MADKVRIAIIGTGLIAEQHAQVIAAHDQAEIVGVCSRTRSRAESFAESCGCQLVCDCMEDLATEAKPDALMIMVNPENMYEVSSAALDCGLPVFFEKPAGLWPDQAAKLAEKAKAANVPTMVGYNRRHYSVFRKGMDIIREHGPLMGVLVEGHERMGGVYECGRFSEECLEGWIYANATHTIDLLHYFGGEIADVNAVGAKWREPGGDQFSASIKFANGAVGTYVSHWLSPGGWRAVLYGDGVSVEFKPLEQGVWTDSKFQTHEIEPDQHDVDGKPGFTGQLDAFCNMVRTGKLEAPSLDLAGALETMQLAEILTKAATKK